MKKLLIIALLLPALAFAEDSWRGRDKVDHFAISGVLGFAARNQWPDEPVKAFGVALIPGLLKELSDSKGGTGFSSKDMVANALGAAVGVSVAGVFIQHNPATKTTRVSWNINL